MAVTLLPLTTRLHRLLGRSAAELRPEHVETVAPAIARPARPAIALPGEIDRVLGWQEETTRDSELRRIAGQATEHGATTVATYRNVTLLDGALYADGAAMRVANRPRRRPVVIGRPARLATALLVTNPVIDRYFGHWILDGLLLEELARTRGVPALSAAGHRWLHEPGYRALTDLRAVHHAHVVIDRLEIADDRGLNQGWCERASAIRARVRSRAAAAGDARPVFLRRGTTGAARALVNEAEIVAALEALGFAIVAPEAEEPATIAAALANAPLIVAVEGSSQYHAALAAPEGATIATIMPPRRFNAIGKVHADAIGLRWAYTVADDAGADSFHQPLDRLLRLIDLTRA